MNTVVLLAALLAAQAGDGPESSRHRAPCLHGRCAVRCAICRIGGRHTECACYFGVAAAADAQASVEAGAKALRPWQGFPWYDPGTDRLRRVEIAARASRSTASMGSLDSLLQGLAWTLLGVLLVAIVFVLVRVYARTPRQRRSRPDDAKPGGADRIESLPFPVGPGRPDLLGEARRCYQNGNYGQAILYLFSFQLVQLDRRQIIHLAQGKTDRQYLREVGSRKSLRQLVEQTMTAFEDVFFGGRTLDRVRFEACWSRLGEFETLLGP